MTEFVSSRAFEGFSSQNTTKASTKSTTFRDLCFMLVVIATCGIIALGDRYLFQKEGDLGELYNLCLITTVTLFFIGSRASLSCTSIVSYLRSGSRRQPDGHKKKQVDQNEKVIYSKECCRIQNNQNFDADAEKGASARCYKEIIALCRAGNLALAQERLSAVTNNYGDGLMLSKRSSQSFAQATVQACLEGGSAKHAATWCSMLVSANVKLSARTVHSVMLALNDAGDTQDAVQFLTNILDAGEHVESACYQLLFEQCIKPDEVQKIEAWLDFLAGRGLEELEKGCIGIIRSRSHTHELHHAEKWLQKGLDAGLTRSPQLCSAMINATARIGCTEEAEKWLTKMIDAGDQKAGPDIINFTEIMVAYAEKGLCEKAVHVFERMLAHGLNPDGVCYGTMIKAHAWSGDLDGAEKWARRALEKDLKLDTYAFNSVIVATARVNQPQLAENWLSLMSSHGTMPDIASYNSVISSWARSGNAIRAERLLNLMLKSNVEPDVGTLGLAVHACARCGDLERAEAVFDAIVSRGTLKPDSISFNALIDACVKGGNLQRADFWMKEMEKAGVEPNVVTHTTLLQAHARASNLEAAGRCLQTMHDAGIKANVVSYSILIHACAKDANVVQAEKWFHEMIESDVTPNVVAYSALLNVSAKAADYIRAEHWFEHMKAANAMPNVVCYTSVIDACAKAGMPERAEAWLIRLCEASKLDNKTWGPGRNGLNGTSEQLCVTRQSFVTAAQAYALQGQWKDVQRIFEGMKERNITMDEFCLTVLLSSFWRCRPPRRDQAEEAFRAHWEQDLKVTAPPLRVLRMILRQQRYEKLAVELGIPELGDKQFSVSKSTVAYL